MPDSARVKAAKQACLREYPGLHGVGAIGFMIGRQSLEPLITELLVALWSAWPYIRQSTPQAVLIDRAMRNAHNEGFSEGEET